MVSLVVIRAGSVRTVFALDHDGRCETFEFISALPERAQRSLDALFQRLADAAWAGRNEERFRHLRGPAFEMKEHTSNVRLYCFVQGRAVICTHGSPKRAGRARVNREIEKVMRLYELCINEGAVK
jgi:hypothetical protein